MGDIDIEAARALCERAELESERRARGFPHSVDDIVACAALVPALLDRLSAAQSEREQWRETAAHNDEVMRDYREHAAAMRDRAAAAEARTRELEATVQRVMGELDFLADNLLQTDRDPVVHDSAACLAGNTRNNLLSSIEPLRRLLRGSDV